MSTLATPTQLSADIRSVVHSAAPVWASVTIDDLHKPTPCAAWDVQALAEHTLNNLAGAVNGAKGTPASDAAAMSADPAASFTLLTRDFADVIDDESVLSRTINMPWGDVTVRDACAKVMGDLMIHTWDLAQAIDEPYAMPVGPAQRVLDAVRAKITDEQRSTSPDATFGPAVPVPADATVQDQLLGFTGRTPR